MMMNWSVVVSRRRQTSSHHYVTPAVLQFLHIPVLSTFIDRSRTLLHPRSWKTPWVISMSTSQEEITDCRRWWSRNRDMAGWHIHIISWVQWTVPVVHGSSGSSSCWSRLRGSLMTKLAAVATRRAVMTMTSVMSRCVETRRSTTRRLSVLTSLMTTQHRCVHALIQTIINHNTVVSQVRTIILSIQSICIPSIPYVTRNSYCIFLRLCYDTACLIANLYLVRCSQIHVIVTQCTVHGDVVSRTYRDKEVSHFHRYRKSDLRHRW